MSHNDLELVNYNIDGNAMFGPIVAIHSGRVDIIAVDVRARHVSWGSVNVNNQVLITTVLSLNKQYAGYGDILEWFIY